MATLTITTLGPTFWALFTMGVCGAVAVLTAIVRRRYHASIAASIDHLHVHCFPLDKKVERRCLICGVRGESDVPTVVGLPGGSRKHPETTRSHMQSSKRRAVLTAVPRLD